MVLFDSGSRKLQAITPHFKEFSLRISFRQRLRTIFFENLKSYFKRAEKREEFVILVIDEFGKLLEYAAKNNPERELYLFQKFTEFINDERRNAILLTTLHQNFNSYSRTLTESQRNEWTKGKRAVFRRLFLNEPIEQLLYLASKRIERTKRDNL